MQFPIKFQSLHQGSIADGFVLAIDLSFLKIGKPDFFCQGVHVFVSMKNTYIENICTTTLPPWNSTNYY